MFSHNKLATSPTNVFCTHQNFKDEITFSLAISVMIHYVQILSFHKYKIMTLIVELRNTDTVIIFFLEKSGTLVFRENKVPRVEILKYFRIFPPYQHQIHCFVITSTQNESVIIPNTTAMFRFRLLNKYHLTERKYLSF